MHAPGAAPSRRSRRLRGRAPPSSGRPPPLDLATHQRHLSKRRPANSHCDPTASRYRPDQSPPPSDPWLPCISRNPIADRSAQSAGLGRVASKPENVRLELPPFPPYLRYKHHPIVEIQIVLERLLRSEPPITWEERIRPLGPMLVPLKDHRAACVTAEGRDDGR